RAVAVPAGKVWRGPYHLGGRPDGQAVRRDVPRHERIRADHGPITDRASGHYEHAPGQPDTLAERHRLIGHRVAIQRVEPHAMRKDETVTPDPRVVADDHGLGRVDERELKDDRAASQC